MEGGLAILDHCKRPPRGGRFSSWMEHLNVGAGVRALKLHEPRD